MLECHKTTEDESLSGPNHSNKAEQHRKPLRRAGIMKDCWHFPDEYDDFPYHDTTNDR